MHLAVRKYTWYRKADDHRQHVGRVRNNIVIIVIAMKGFLIIFNLLIQRVIEHFFKIYELSQYVLSFET